MSKKKKEKYVDDGHTIYSMDVDASWSTKKESKSKFLVTKEELKTLIKAAFNAYLPKLFLVLIGFGLAIILIYFWLK